MILRGRRLCSGWWVPGRQRIFNDWYYGLDAETIISLSIEVMVSFRFYDKWLIAFGWNVRWICLQIEGSSSTPPIKKFMSIYDCRVYHPRTFFFMGTANRALHIRYSCKRCFTRHLMTCKYQRLIIFWYIARTCLCYMNHVVPLHTRHVLLFGFPISFNKLNPIPMFYTLFDADIFHWRNSLKYKS